ncbi:MAG: hypothetical protein ACOCQ5_01175 [Halanaerobiales bacterium]
MDINNVNFEIKQDQENYYIVANPEKSMYSIKIKFKKDCPQKKVEKSLSLFKETVSDVDLKLF